MPYISKRLRIRLTKFASLLRGSILCFFYFPTCVVYFTKYTTLLILNTIVLFISFLLYLSFLITSFLFSSFVFLGLAALSFVHFIATHIVTNLSHSLTKIAGLYMNKNCQVSFYYVLKVIKYAISTYIVFHCPF